MVSECSTINFRISIAPANEKPNLGRSAHGYHIIFCRFLSTTDGQVFDPAGRWLGGMEVPPEGRVAEIGNDYVLGIWKDDQGAGTVRMYGLRKPGAS